MQIPLREIRAIPGSENPVLAAYRQALEWKPGDEGIQAKIQALSGQ